MGLAIVQKSFREWTRERSLFSWKELTAGRAQYSSPEPKQLEESAVPSASPGS